MSSWSAGASATSWPSWAGISGRAGRRSGRTAGRPCSRSSSRASARSPSAGLSSVRQAGAGCASSGSSLLILSGLGMAALSFKTDAEGADATWHGQLHVIAYFTFFLSLLLAYVFLGWGSWRRFASSSWKYAPLALVPLLGALVL
ncbi:MAG: DUF998 domain-containing protein, partial [Gaiellaceae bacterium]